jgi:hypothetical protein
VTSTAAAAGHSLLLSTVKLLGAAQQMRLPVTYQVVETSLQVASISRAAAAVALQPDQQQQQQQFAGRAAAGWLWLCGKCLLALADVLMQQNSSTLVDIEGPDGVLQLSISLTPRAVFSNCVALVQGAGALLHSQLGAAADAMPAAAATTAVQELVFALADAARECNDALDRELSLFAAADPAEDKHGDRLADIIVSESSSRGNAPPSVLCIRELQRVSSKLSVGQQLKSFAAAVCGLSPNRQCCNNPGCGSCSGLSEAALVGGKSCRCGGCKVARYCSRECQVRWRHHAVGAIAVLLLWCSYHCGHSADGVCDTLLVVLFIAIIEASAARWQGTAARTLGDRSMVH